MSNYHDPVRHLEYLRQSLSQDKKPIGFFISAGCPLAVTMPTEDKWPLIPDVKNLTLWINEQLKDNPEYKILLAELVKSKKNPNNIEDILSFLRGLQSVSVGGNVRGLSEKNLSDLEKIICKKIVEKVYVSLPDDKTPYHTLVKWINSIDREIPIEVFTTNYDLLLEEALEYLEVPYFDGFVGSIKSFFDLRAVENGIIPFHWTRLWKIHGSLNWYQDISTENKKIFRSSEVKNDATQLIYPSHLKYDQSRKMPYLALIDQLSNFIKQKSSLLIISGYSFNDDHLNDTIINALKANPSAMVLALMHETYSVVNTTGGSDDRYPKAYKLAEKRPNLNIWTNDKAYIGTNLGEWKKIKQTEEQAILKFIETETKIVVGSPDTVETTIKLGNFNTFAEFLKTLIGFDKLTDKDSVK